MKSLVIRLGPISSESVQFWLAMTSYLKCDVVMRRTMLEWFSNHLYKP